MFDQAKTLRLAEMQEGPAEGWRWEATEPPIFRLGRPLTACEPVAVAMVAAWAAHHREVRSLPPTLDDSCRVAVAYQAGLVHAIRGQSEANSARTNAFGPVRAEPGNRLQEQLDRCIAKLGIRDESTSDVLRYVMDDLCQNVFQHARSRSGAWLAGAMNPKSLRVRVAVADCGIGIAQDIRETYTGAKSLSEADAVAMALQPEFSGSREPGQNRGVGLTVVRKLAVSGHGAFWVRTGNVVATSAADSPSSKEPAVSELANPPWRGTAVSVLLRAGAIGDYHVRLREILDEIEGKGPHYADVQFIKRAADGRGRVIAIEPDASSFALDRARAGSIRTTLLEPALASGGPVTLDFAAARNVSQGFAHALLSETARQHGPHLLAKLAFAACSNSTRLMIREAINHGLRDHE